MKALVLSGGGSRGAFQVGVIKRLVELGRRWDVVAGVSVGAINAVGLAMYKPADQALGARALEAFWHEIKGDASVYDGRFGGPLALLTQPSLNTTAPLERLLRARFDAARLRSSGVRLLIGAVGLRSGRYVSVDGTVADPLRWVMASAAMPVLFPPVEIAGELYVDGGVRDCTPLTDAIKAGATEVDVVLTNPVTGDDTPWAVHGSPTGLAVAARAAGLLADEVFLTDLDAIRLNPTVTVHLYAPWAPWTVDAFRFDPTEIRHQIDVGYGVP